MLGAVAQQSKIARTKRLTYDTCTTAEMRHIPGSVGRSVGMTDLPSEICVRETHLYFICVFTDIFFVREQQKSARSRTNELKCNICLCFVVLVMFSFFLRVREYRQKKIVVFTNKEGIFRFVHRTPVASFRALCAPDSSRPPSPPPPFRHRLSHPLHDV